MATTPITLYILSTGKTAIIKKLLWFSGQGGNVLLEIGTGLAPFVRRLPRFTCVPAIHDGMSEWELPLVEFSANITMQTDAAGADPAHIQVVCEVEEIG
jgi:hypothetical protein